MSNVTYFASESVCAGHPDKVADQISDALLDAYLAQDPTSKVAIETLVAHDSIVLAGEVTSKGRVSVEAVVRQQLQKLGYTRPEWGFSDQTKIQNYLHTQSPQIAQTVDDFGAGDQGMMFGFACDETPEFLPLPIALAHALTRALDAAREEALLPYLRPDGKAQVVVRYENKRPIAIEHVTLAVPHDEHTSPAMVRNDLYQQIVTPVLAKYGYNLRQDDLVVNGGGVWFIPGPSTDAGLTGRKIIVDSYGGFARVGGGAFSGKDPSKVDRSGAYAARYIAKNIVAAGLAAQAEVALAYYIGAKEPVMLTIDTSDTATVSQQELQHFAQKVLKPSVKNIITALDLLQPIYTQTAAYGHFGRKGLPWERVITSEEGAS